MTQEDYWAEVAHKAAEKLLHEFESWYGAGRVFSRSELCRLGECTDSVVKLALRYLRGQGHLVVAVNGGGFRLARSVGEARDYVQSLVAQVESLQATIAALEEELALRQSSTQLELL